MMTYCVAVAVDEGLVFCSDSRTSAGVDQISTYSKMHRFGRVGDRQIVILTSGNLATSQAVIGQISRDVKDERSRNLMNVGTISELAEYVGELSLHHQERFRTSKGTFEATFLLGGQIRDNRPRIVMIYPEGNNITSSRDTPYLQIGESKYGKPILDRILTPQTRLETAALCALVSMDSTMRSNLTVGPPIELSLYRTDSLTLAARQRFTSDSEYFSRLNRSWDQLLKQAFNQLPQLNWNETAREYNGFRETSEEHVEYT